MMLILDLAFSFLEWGVESLGCRRANWVFFVAGVVIGCACLAFGYPGWAAFTFGASAVDAWTLKRGGYRDDG